MKSLCFPAFRRFRRSPFLSRNATHFLKCVVILGSYDERRKRRNDYQISHPQATHNPPPITHDNRIHPAANRPAQRTSTQPEPSQGWGVGKNSSPETPSLTGPRPLTFPTETFLNSISLPITSETMNKTTSKRRESGTIAKLAKDLGYTPRHTGTLIKSGMPDTLDDAKKWLSEREDNDTAAALRKERIKLVKAQRIAVETANARSAGELVPKAKIEADAVILAAAMQALFRKLETSLPQLCLGLSLSQSTPLVRQRIREIQDSFSAMSEEFFGKQPHQEP
jgi:hypothetical protein